MEDKIYQFDDSYHFRRKRIQRFDLDHSNLLLVDVILLKNPSPCLKYQLVLHLKVQDFQSSFNE